MVFEKGDILSRKGILFKIITFAYDANENLFLIIKDKSGYDNFLIPYEEAVKEFVLVKRRWFR